MVTKLSKLVRGTPEVPSGGIDWSQFDLEAVPEVAAARSSLNTLGARRRELDTAMDEYRLAVRTRPPVNPITQRAQSLLAEIEGGVAVVDDSPKEADYLRNHAELQAVEKAIALVNPKLEEAKNRAAINIRRKLTPHRKPVVEQMRSAVLQMIEALDAKLAFNREIDVRQLSGYDSGEGFPWRVTYIENTLREKLQMWVKEFDQTRGFIHEEP